MEEKKAKLLEQLQRMKDGAQKSVDHGGEFFIMHAKCAIELLAELQHNLPQFGEGFMARLSLYSAKLAEKLFNEGWFNSIAVGYGKIALDRMGIKLLSQFESEMSKAFDLYTAEEAQKIYQRIEGATV